MQRPVAVTIVSLLLCAAALYLWTVGTTLLIWPGTVSLMSANQLMHGLELAGPFMMLLFGTGYALVGWGMFRLHNWARVIVILLIVIRVAALVPKISMAELGVPILWYGLQIALQVALAWYLTQAPSVMDAFTQKRHRSTRILTDKPEK
jgi:hypothetical protein